MRIHASDLRDVRDSGSRLNILILSDDRDRAVEKFHGLKEREYSSLQITTYSDVLKSMSANPPPDLIFLDGAPPSSADPNFAAILHQKYHIPAVNLITGTPGQPQFLSNLTASSAFFCPTSDENKGSFFVDLTLLQALSLRTRGVDTDFHSPHRPYADINIKINFQGDILSLLPADGNVEYFCEDERISNLGGFIHQDDIAAVRGMLDEFARDRNAPSNCRFRAKTKSGIFRFMDAYASIITPDSGDEIISLACYDLAYPIQPDITFPSSGPDADRWIDVLSVPVFVCDLLLSVKFVNQTWLDFTGKTLNAEIGEGWKSDLHPEDLDKLLYLFDRAVARKQDLKTEVRMYRKDGEVRWMLVTGKLRCEADQTPVEFVGACVDITEYKNIEESLYYLASHDSLTGLYNRAFYEEEMIRFEKSSRFPISVVVADVDGMKLANDILGHRAGDELLRRSARVLFETFRSEDIVARIGGDEFAILLPDTEEQVALEAIDRVRGCLRSQISEYPEFPLRLSMGAATAGRDLPLNEALILADRRMYNDKLLKR